MSRFGIGINHSYTFTRLHIPSGKRQDEVRQFNSSLEFLTQLNEWNRSNPGVWQYWAESQLVYDYRNSVK